MPDAFLAALAIESGSEWVTADRDYLVFQACVSGTLLNNLAPALESTVFTYHACSALEAQKLLLPEAGGAGIEERGPRLAHGEFNRRRAALALLPRA